MAKEDMLELDGIVVECLPNTLFKVECQQGDATMEVMATISGRMRKNNIRVLLVDRVSLEVSMYDITKGRIVYRYK